MAKWNQIVITTAGMNLSAETLSGKQIQYTHAQTTDTDLSGMTNDDIKALTSFDSVVQDLNIGTVTVADDHTVQLPVQLTNQDVTADYKLYGIAIFAKPVGGTEILYGVAVATVPDTIPAKGGTTVIGTDFNLKVHVSDSSNVQITVVQTAGVTNEQLVQTLNKYTLESDLTKKLANYTATADMPALIANNVPANILTKDNLTTQVADLAQTDKANTFTQPQTFKQGALAPNGKSYITADDVKPTDLTGLDTKADAQTAHEELSAPNLIDVATDDWQIVPTGIWNVHFPYQVIAGHTYFFGADLQSSATSPTNIFAWSDVKNQTMLSGFKQPTPVAKSSTGTVGTIFTAPTTMTIYVVVGALNSNDPWKYRHVVFTETSFEMTYAQAQANRHGTDGVDKTQDLVGGRNYVLNSVQTTSMTGTGVTGNSVGNWNLSGDFLKLPVGTQVTIACDITVSNADGGQIYFGYFNPWTVFYSAAQSTNGTTHVAFQTTVKSITTITPGLKMTVDHSKATYTVSNMKLNIGSFEKELSPAPEDKVTDNHDGTMNLNGQVIAPLNTNHTKLTTTTDLHTIITPGIYATQWAAGNSDWKTKYNSPVSNWGTLVVIQGYTGITHIYFPDDVTPGMVFIETKNSSGWSNWKQMATTDVLANYQGRNPSTGTATSKLNFNTGDLTVNNLAVRGNKFADTQLTWLGSTSGDLTGGSQMYGFIRNDILYIEGNIVIGRFTSIGNDALPSGVIDMTKAFPSVLSTGAFNSSKALILGTLEWDRDTPEPNSDAWKHLQVLYNKDNKHFEVASNADYMPQNVQYRANISFAIPLYY